MTSFDLIGSDLWFRGVFFCVSSSPVLKLRRALSTMRPVFLMSYHYSTVWHPINNTDGFQTTDVGQTNIHGMLVYMFGTWLRTGWCDSCGWRWGVPPGEGTPEVEAERPSLHADFESAKHKLIDIYMYLQIHSKIKHWRHKSRRLCSSFWSLNRIKKRLDDKIDLQQTQ